MAPLKASPVTGAGRLVVLHAGWVRRSVLRDAHAHRTQQRLVSRLRLLETVSSPLATRHVIPANVSRSKLV